MHKDDEFDSEDSLAYQEHHAKVQYISIKRHLPEAKSLLQGTTFEPYQPRILFDSRIDLLPAAKGTSEDPCHMNLLEQAMFDHLRLKQQVKQAIHGVEQDTLLSGSNLHDRYKGQVPVYQKFPHRDRKYFATEMVSLRGGKRLPKSNSAKWMVPQGGVSIDSNFEFGNLCKAYCVGHHAYQLVLQNDVNTKGNNQWFFFRVRGAPKNSVLKFQIVNLIKKESLFNQGMKPTVFSKMRYQKKGIGWVREGQKVAYSPNMIRKEFRDGHHYSLSFEYKPIFDQDEIYFSHSYPYTYSDLNNFLSRTFAQVRPNLILALGNVGQSIAGNRVDMVTITGKGSTKKRKVVWIMARQHPGEVTGSFVIEGIVNTLLGQSDFAKYLRQEVVFKIIPMINPDGVLHGNSRCQLVGTDPNRKWKTTSKTITPIIYQVKQLMGKSPNVDMVLDIHSHSRKLGTFFYGNLQKQKQRSRVYPLIVCQNDLRFSFNGSRFSEGPKTTARYSLHKLLNIHNVFTVQSSFYGYESGSRIIEYLPDDYRSIGRSLLEGYAIMMNENSPRLERFSLSTALQRLHEQPDLIQQGDRLSVGSDSDPSADQLDGNQLQRVLPKKAGIRKKKKVKSKMTKKKTEVKEQASSMKELPKPEVAENPKPERVNISVYKRKGSLAPMPRKYSVESQRGESLRRQLPIFNPSKSVQTQELYLLKPSNRVVDFSKHLVIVGQKVQDREIWLEGNNTIGIQSSIGQVFSVSKADLKRPIRVARLVTKAKQNQCFVRQCSRQ